MVSNLRASLDQPNSFGSNRAQQRNAGLAVDLPTGIRYSLLYLQPEQLMADSSRLRRRFRTLLNAQFPLESESIGRFIEAELGIIVLKLYYVYSVEWKYLDDCEMRDVLDSVTLVARFMQKNRVSIDQYLADARRILSEESANYLIDDSFGVHPFIDSGYQATLVSVIRGLDGPRFIAAREHVQRSDKELLPTGNNREAVRAIFDASENIFKQMYPSATSINKGNIHNELRPRMERIYLDPVAKRAALKIVDAFSSWVDGAHKECLKNLPLSA